MNYITKVLGNVNRKEGVAHNPFWVMCYMVYMGLFNKKQSTPHKISNNRVITVKELVGKKYDYYEDIFKSFEKGEKKHFNIYALLFAPYWYVYKKMIFTGIGIIGLQVILATLAYFLPNPITIGLYALSFLLYLKAGFYGEYDYYKNVMSNKKFSESIDDKFKDRFVKDKSGDDIYMMICWLVGSIIIYVVALFIQY